MPDRVRPIVTLRPASRNGYLPVREAWEVREVVKKALICHWAYVVMQCMALAWVSGVHGRRSHNRSFMQAHLPVSDEMNTDATLFEVSPRDMQVLCRYMRVCIHEGQKRYEERPIPPSIAVPSLI